MERRKSTKKIIETYYLKWTQVSYLIEYTQLDGMVFLSRKSFSYCNFNSNNFIGAGFGCWLGDETAACWIGRGFCIADNTWRKHRNFPSKGNGSSTATIFSMYFRA
jgi:hypothetical protein